MLSCSIGSRVAQNHALCAAIRWNWPARPTKLWPMRTVAVLFLAFCVSASAGTLPGQHPRPARPQPSRTQLKPIDTLFAELRQAQTSEDAKAIEDQIGLFFMQSGSPSIDLL